MCGRYSAAKPFLALVRSLGVKLQKMGEWTPRYNIAPTQPAPMVYKPANGLELGKARWGFESFRRENHASGPLRINARLETLADKPGFDKLHLSKRCLLPADGFYEWQTRNGRRQPFRVVLKDQEPFFMAGLWRSGGIQSHATSPGSSAPNQGQETETAYTVITCPACPALQPLHDRMPVILRGAEALAWMEIPGQTSDSINQMAYAGPFFIYPVGEWVNSAKTEDPRCIDRIRLDLDWFEQPWWEQ